MILKGTRKQIDMEIMKQPGHPAVARAWEIDRIEPGSGLANLWQPISYIPCRSNNNYGFGPLIDRFLTDNDADCIMLFIRNDAGSYFARSWAGKIEPGWEGLCRSLPKATVPALYCASHCALGLGELLTDAGISAVLYVPVVVGGEVNGALYVIRAAGKACFTAGDLDEASLLGEHSSPIIENTRLYSKCDMQRLQMDILVRGISSAHETERKRVANEIHDTVAQWMVGASYSIRACGALVSKARLGDLEQELNKVENVLHMSTQELRRVISNLRASALKQFGFAGALHKIAETLGEDGITCRVYINPGLPELNAHEESAVYSVVQEALNNVRKHSGADGVDINIGCFQENVISVEISDNGKGFDVAEVIKGTVALEHIGLQSMRERVAMLGGCLNIESKPGKGTSLTFTFSPARPFPCLVQI